jgi:hypothetical protein
MDKFKAVDRVLGVISLLIGLSGITAMVGGVLAGGVVSRLLFSFAGALSAVTAVAAVTLIFGALTRAQLAQIDPGGKGLAMPFAPTSEVLRGLKSVGIEPAWTLRGPVLFAAAGRLEFWTGYRDAFRFGQLEYSQIVDVSVNGRFLEVALNGARDTKILRLELRELKRGVVFRASHDYVRDAAQSIILAREGAMWRGQQPDQAR